MSTLGSLRAAAQGATRLHGLDQQAVANPREVSADLWSWKPDTDPTYNRAFLPAYQQAQAGQYFKMLEPSNYTGTRPNEILTGREPYFYGQMRYERNPLDNNSTNWAAEDMLNMTRTDPTNGSLQIHCQTQEIPFNPYWRTSDYIGSQTYPLQMLFGSVGQ